MDSASWREFDGYLLNSKNSASLIYAYTNTDEDSHSILAWPGKAKHHELVGLPPTVISVNELDPLRDEGVDFYHKLVLAGVRAQLKVIGGTGHACDLSASILPDLADAAISAVVAFAHSLVNSKL